MTSAGGPGPAVEIAGIPLGNRLPFVLFGGLNVLESRELALRVAQTHVDVTTRLGIPYVFKASFDKANRSSIDSFRGPGLDEGLEMLRAVKEAFGVPVITDVHTPEQAAPVAEVADVLQLPAFLTRQTDLVQAVARTGAAVNIKKAQFLAPAEMANIAGKCRAMGNDRIILCERGTSFGYNNLVVDMLAFGAMKSLGHPVIFDVTHSLQTPGTQGVAAGGRRESLVPLGRAGLACGIAGLFLESHPEPDAARCDGQCALRLDRLDGYLRQMKAVDEVVKALDELDTA